MHCAIAGLLGLFQPCFGSYEWVRAFFNGGNQIRPSPSLRGTQFGFGGTRWGPALLYVGPYTPLGFCNAN